jgi:hypothetical protein
MLPGRRLLSGRSLLRHGRHDRGQEDVLLLSRRCLLPRRQLLRARRQESGEGIVLPGRSLLPGRGLLCGRSQDGREVAASLPAGATVPAGRSTGPLLVSWHYPSPFPRVSFSSFTPDPAGNFFLNHSRTDSAPLASTAAAMLAAIFGLSR